MSKIDSIKEDIFKRCENGVKSAGDEIYKKIDKHLVRYYMEFEPEYYNREYYLLTSLRNETDGKKINVYFDENMLNYAKKNVVMNLPDGNTTNVSARWGGHEVLDTSMKGLHGGYHQGGTEIWADSMKDIGSVKEVVKKNLSAAGLPIK